MNKGYSSAVEPLAAVVAGIVVVPVVAKLARLAGVVAVAVVGVDFVNFDVKIEPVLVSLVLLVVGVWVDVVVLSAISKTLAVLEVEGLELVAHL